MNSSSLLPAYLSVATFPNKWLPVALSLCPELVLLRHCNLNVLARFVHSQLPQKFTDTFLIVLYQNLRSLGKHEHDNLCVEIIIIKKIGLVDEMSEIVPSLVSMNLKAHTSSW